MNNTPKELEETPLCLQVVFDPQTKCVTMKTHTDEIAENNVTISPDLIPNDPLLQHFNAAAVNIENASELDKLIIAERERLLNIKRPRKPIVNRRSHKGTSQNSVNNDGSDAFHVLTQNEKSKLRMRKLRERESSEERDLRRFRYRIITNKMRLLQRLKNFDNETFLKEITKRNTEKVKRNRLERKAKETPEQKALRKMHVNSRSRLAKIRRKAFKTPEELQDDKEKRLAYREKIWSRYTDEQRRDLQKASRDKAKERHRTNIKEWKEVEMVIKGSTVKEFGVKSKLMDKI